MWNWRRYLSIKIESQAIAIILRGLIIFGVLFFSGCIRHPHGKYEEHKITIPVTLIAENVPVVDELVGIELLDENSSHFTKIFDTNHRYVYENTIYFDRLVYISEIIIHHPGILNEVKINDEEESVFINKVKKSTNCVNIKVSINSDLIPQDVITMDVKTMRDPEGAETWSK